jgi:hypothetical protein
MIVTSQEHTADQMATLPPKDSNQSNKLNEMRLKYGLQSAAAERDEKDEGRRNSRSTTTKTNKTKKQVDDSQREEPDDAHTSFLDTKKAELMWGSVATMLRKKISAGGCGYGLTADEAAVFEGLLIGAVDEEDNAVEYFSPEDTAEEKGLAVVFAFSDYKQKQAAAATKAIKVQISSEELARAKNLKKLKKRKAAHVALVEELNEANREKLIALTKVTGMWNALSSSERKAIGGLGEIEKELFEGIESKTLLGSLSRKLFGGVKRSLELIKDGASEEDLDSIANSLLQQVNNIMGFADDTSTLYTDETSITAETDAVTAATDGTNFAGKIRNLMKAALETDDRTEYTDGYTMATDADDTRTEYTDDHTRDTRTTAASDPLAPIMNWLRDQTQA